MYPANTPTNTHTKKEGEIMNTLESLTTAAEAITFT